MPTDRDDMMAAVINEDCRGRVRSELRIEPELEELHERHARERDEVPEQYEDYAGSYGMYEVYGTPQDVIDDDNRERARDMNAVLNERGFW